MVDDNSRKRLGRGLAALIGEMDQPIDRDIAPAKVEARADMMVEIDHIVPNPVNPRRHFDDEMLADLAQSIGTHGIVQPIVVRPDPNNAERFELIAGERRWRAAQRAGLTRVPVIVRAVDDRVALEIAIVENVQRSDLNPVEEALGYQQLLDSYDYTQNALSEVIGKSRSHVANTLRLLKLPVAVQSYVSSGQLTAGHARALITMDNAEAVAERIVRDGLSVREAEALAQAPQREPDQGVASAQTVQDPNTKAFEKSLSDALGMKVSISEKGKGGVLKLSYKSLEQLDEIARRLSRE